MIKKILFTLTSLCVLLLFVCTYLFLNRAELISKVLSEAMEVHIQIEGIDISKQGITIRKLSIQNPPECFMKNALNSDIITIQFNWNALIKALVGLSSQSIVIDSLTIAQSKMGIELFTITGADNNWTRIFNTSATSINEPSTITFQVKELLLTDIRIEANYHDLSKITPPQPVQIKKISIQDIGNDKDINTKQIFLIISKVLIENAAKQLNLNTMLQQMILEKMIPLPLMEIDAAKNLIDKFFQNNTNSNQPNN